MTEVMEMVYGGYTYLEPDYRPDLKNDLLVWHWVSGSRDIEKLAEAIAAESSVGTWTKLKTINKEVFTRLRAKVYKIQKVGDRAGFVWLAYPLEHFDTKNLLQILASIRGNIYGLSELDALRFLDIWLPKRLQKLYPGPKFGLNGIRKRVGTQKTRRPHIGTIVKPKVGLAPKEWAKVAYDAYIGGVDFVKDDENLVDQEFCPWEERVYEVLRVIDKVEKETGRKVVYSPNITDTYTRMLERLEQLKEFGWDWVMLDVYMIGYSALQDIVRELHKNNFFIHAHRAGHTAETRGAFGVEYNVFAKLWRLIGVEQLHTGTGVGKMEGAPAMIRQYGDICRKSKAPEAPYLFSLGFEWLPEINPLLPVASGGLNAGSVDALLEIYGHDVVVQCGGGIHGHPGGTRAGAKSVKDAVEGAMRGKTSPAVEKKSKELKQALDTWGYTDPVSVRMKLRTIDKNQNLLTDLLMKGGYNAAALLDKF
ncbi:ribulose-1,5-bisphosphate carboxylase/oxygenase large subunit [[Eubacterium] cellulosolvens]